MMYKVQITSYAFQEIIQLTYSLHEKHIGHEIIQTLKSLNIFPWSFPSAANKYDPLLPQNIRVIPLKHHYLGIYYIIGHLVKVTNVESQYKNIKELLQKMENN